jgi:hypothetical protein
MEGRCMFTGLIESIAGAIGSMIAGSTGDSVPGSTVTGEQLRRVLTNTQKVSRRLGKLSRLHAELLTDLIPERVKIAPPSEGLKALDTAAIIAALKNAKDGAVNLAAEFPNWATELETIGRKLGEVAAEWEAIAAADLGNEEQSFARSISIRGPKTRIAAIQAAVNRAADDAIINALVDYRLGIVPATGQLLVIGDEPQLIEGLSITGEELERRVEELGGTLASEEEVTSSLATLERSDDEESDEDDDGEEEDFDGDDEDDDSDDE